MRVFKRKRGGRESACWYTEFTDAAGVRGRQESKWPLGRQRCGLDNCSVSYPDRGRSMLPSKPCFGC